jgi:hypothetical protein
MSKIENNLEKFKAILEPVTKGMSFGKKDYLNKLFAEIIAEVNYQEVEINNFKARQLGFNSSEEYTDSLFKAVAILQTMGFGEIDFHSLRKEIIEWMIDNNKHMKPMTYSSFTATYKWVNHFLLFNERLPVALDELTDYINDFKND